MKRILLTLSISVLFVGCSDPLTQPYNPDTYQSDIKDLPVEDQKIISDFVTESNAALLMIESFGTAFGKDITTQMDSMKLLIQEKTYGEILESERKKIRDEFVADSTANYEAIQRRLEYEAKQKKYSSLIEFTPISIKESDSDYNFGDTHIIKIGIKSTEGEKIRALSFKVTFKDVKGTELESSLFSASLVDAEGVFAWEINSYNDLYKYIKGASVDEYMYDFEIQEMIYKGEQIIIEE